MSLAVRNIAGDVVYQLRIAEHAPLSFGDLRVRLANVCGSYYGSLSLLTETGSELGNEYDDTLLTTREFEILTDEVDEP